jgi:hypothetical protein
VFICRNQEKGEKGGTTKRKILDLTCTRPEEKQRPRGRTRRGFDDEAHDEKA